MTIPISNSSMEQSLKRIATALENQNDILQKLITQEDLTEVSSEQLTDLTQKADTAKATSDLLSQAIEHNQ